jgi:hypothetical protein
MASTVHLLVYFSKQKRESFKLFLRKELKQMNSAHLISVCLQLYGMCSQLQLMAFGSLPVFSFQESSWEPQWVDCTQD